MPPYTFKATTDEMKINADYHVQFTTVVDNTLGAQYDPNTGTLVTPRPGTYALSAEILPDSSPVTLADFEIIVDGVQTPLVLNEKKTCARVVLTLDLDKRVWVQYFGNKTTLLPAFGQLSVCLLHGSLN